jgi:hypothetical protein
MQLQSHKLRACISTLYISSPFDFTRSLEFLLNIKNFPRRCGLERKIQMVQSFHWINAGTSMLQASRHWDGGALVTPQASLDWRTIFSGTGTIGSRPGSHCHLKNFACILETCGAPKFTHQPRHVYTMSLLIFERALLESARSSWLVLDSFMSAGDGKCHLRRPVPNHQLLSHCEIDLDGLASWMLRGESAALNMRIGGLVSQPTY